MSVEPFPIKVLRDSKWETMQTTELLPGDIVSVGESSAPQTLLPVLTPLLVYY